MNKISVVLCAKNEEVRIANSLKSILKNKIDEVIIVDGNSYDKTIEIAKNFDCKIIKSKSGSLTYDRQLGINNAKKFNDIAMIDADHVLKDNDIELLYLDLVKYNLDIVQSQFKTYENNSLLSIAEDQLYFIQHNKPGIKKMIGTAPAIYKRDIFKEIKFDSNITKKIDDTDFIYRLSKLKKYKVGVGDTVIMQNHIPNVKHFINKYIGYGYGDGEFIFKYPKKIFSIFYNLIFWYLFVYPLKSVIYLKLMAAPLFFFQGLLRIVGMFKYFLTKKN